MTMSDLPKEEEKLSLTLKTHDTSATPFEIPIEIRTNKYANSPTSHYDSMSDDTEHLGAYFGK